MFYKKDLGHEIDIFWMTKIKFLFSIYALMVLQILEKLTVVIFQGEFVIGFFEITN